jgi:hypothetical protein
MHPEQVALLAKRLGYNEEVIAACYLHDVVEDTNITLDDLTEMFPSIILNAVESVTYMGKDYEEKIAKALADPIGHVVKFCDASCNFSNGVLFGVKPGRRDDEVLLRRAGYISKLLDDLPSPVRIESYVQESKHPA